MTHTTVSKSYTSKGARFNVNIHHAHGTINAGGNHATLGAAVRDAKRQAKELHITYIHADTATTPATYGE